MVHIHRKTLGYYTLYKVENAIMYKWYIRKIITTKNLIRMYSYYKLKERNSE